MEAARRAAAAAVEMDVARTAHCVSFSPQIKYRESGKTEITSSLYALLPETTETQLAKEHSELQSDVRQAATAPGPQEAAADTLEWRSEPCPSQSGLLSVNAHMFQLLVQ